EAEEPLHLRGGTVRHALGCGDGDELLSARLEPCLDDLHRWPVLEILVLVHGCTVATDLLRERFLGEAGGGARLDHHGHKDVAAELGRGVGHASTSPAEDLTRTVGPANVGA